MSSSACPLLSQEGWLRHQENFKFLGGADGVVPKPKRFKNAFRNVPVRNHPVCAIKGSSDIF